MLKVIAIIAFGFPLATIAQSPRELSLTDAQALARRVTPEMEAAREAVRAAQGRELQAGSFSNPALTFSAERTTGGPDFTRQQIAGFEQRLELAGQRGARRSAAGFRTRAAEARLGQTGAQLDFEVASAYARAAGADRRATLAHEANTAFTEAVRVGAQRLAAGDISLYAHRRLRLEAARYSALEAQANLESRTARITLAALISASPASLTVLGALNDSVPAVLSELDVADLQATAFVNRSDLSAATSEIEALAAELSLARAERVPTPVISGGYKSERQANTPGLSGFAASVSIPLSLWDRRAGAIQAADAEARRAIAERAMLRRRISAEIASAHDAVITAERERAILAPQLGAESAAALRSAQVAYNEGDITLVEWLDAVRAYNEAESAYATLSAEVGIRRAALERLVGTPLSAINSRSRADSTSSKLPR